MTKITSKLMASTSAEISDDAIIFAKKSGLNIERRDGNKCSGCFFDSVGHPCDIIDICSPDGDEYCGVIFTRG